MRSKVRALAITPPAMRLTFRDVLKAAEQVPPTPTNQRIFYHLSSRWGLGLVAAASVAVAMVTGMLATATLESFSRDGNVFDGQAQVQQYPVRPEPHPADNSAGVPQGGGGTDVVPALQGSLVRTGSIHLKHERPGDVYTQVTALVTILGGFVTRLTRQGSGEDATVELEVAIPSDKFSEFTVKTANLGEVVSQTESAEDVAGQQIDLKARLAESEAYLKRLDALSEKPSNVSELAAYERQRREVALEIERYRRAIAALENRTSFARMNMSIAAKAPAQPQAQGDLAKAWDDGVDGLEKTSAFMLKTGIAGSPVLLAGALVYLAIRRKRRKAEAQSV
ncbi:MAG: DUF4349 domain-containing protein [Planctomycetes bacterium]|nr:DUF4349 domain-containing protein [Planctomycetota bacterium]